MENKKRMPHITVQNVPITVVSIEQKDYISLTDIAKARTES